MSRRPTLVAGTAALAFAVASPSNAQVTRVSVGYTNVDGIVWSAGTAALGTPLP